MGSFATMSNEELADLYCAVRCEYVDLRAQVPFPDPEYFTALDEQSNQIHEEMAERGMLAEAA
ncbi:MULTISPECIES: hypothetical protein [Rhodococcus]|uniref:hypothetical protein n=1 Tax=Rhodococcus TaxID=1827 RepID=UPI0007AE92C8|nr:MULTISPECIES: hypothetical protein [Rhodococcus]KZL33211.1 hypothetical protein A3852_13020 [Rhodococcus qingshengii]MCE4161630.1 hypothetical protein [Rhodococcus sp. Ni2]